MEEKEITLKDINPNLATEENQSVPKIVSVEELAKQLPEDPNKEIRYESYVDEIVNTAGTEAVKEVQLKALEAIVENPELFPGLIEDDEKEIDGDVDIDEAPSTVSKPSTKKDKEEDDLDIDDDEDDYNKVELEDSVEDERAEQYEKLKAALKERIKPIANKIDLATFTISSKPIKLHKAMSENFAQNQKRIADWALMATGTPISMLEFGALEIQALDPDNSTRNEYNTHKDIYRAFYDHLTGNNLPTFDEFIQLVKFEDIEHLYFTAYKSTFTKDNLIPYTCEKCKHIFVKDVSIDDMVKYKDETAEKSFNLIMEDVGSFIKTEKETELLQISDGFVVALRNPSIYDIVLEPRLLAQSYRAKHAQLITMISYIDNIYTIHRDTNELIPLSYAANDDDEQKRYKKKIQAYGEVIKSLDPKQHFQLTKMIEQIPSFNDAVSFIIPECTCEKCNHIIPEQPQSAQNLLFTQHQLAAIANS